MLVRLNLEWKSVRKKTHVFAAGDGRPSRRPWRACVPCPDSRDHVSMSPTREKDGGHESVDNLTPLATGLRRRHASTTTRLRRRDWQTWLRCELLIDYYNTQQGRRHGFSPVGARHANEVTFPFTYGMEYILYSLHGMDRSLDSIGTCVTKMQRGFSPISEERWFF